MMGTVSRCGSLDYSMMVIRIVSTTPVRSLKCRRVYGVTSLMLTRASESAVTSVSTGG